MITNSPAYKGLTKAMRVMHGPCIDTVIKLGSDLGFNLIQEVQTKLTKIRSNYFDKEMRK